MKKALVPNYVFDDDDKPLKEYIYFCMNPYYNELDEEGRKIFNSLMSNEKVYTEKMFSSLIKTIALVTFIVTERMLIAIKELTELIDKEGTANYVYWKSCEENYSQQLQKLNELSNKFLLWR